MSMEGSGRRLLFFFSVKLLPHHTLILQVLGEDLILVKGQQERLVAGANVWANPVSYDKLGIKYRRWRNTLATGSAAEQQQAKEELVEMGAGELFRLHEEE